MAPDDQHRAKAEEKERQRWIGELMKLLEDAGFLGNAVREQDALKHLAARVAAGRRSRRATPGLHVSGQRRPVRRWKSHGLGRLESWM